MGKSRRRFKYSNCRMGPLLGTIRSKSGGLLTFTDLHLPPRGAKLRNVTNCRAAQWARRKKISPKKVLNSGVLFKNRSDKFSNTLFVGTPDSLTPLTTPEFRSAVQNKAGAPQSALAALVGFPID